MHLEVFSEGNSFLHRADPRVKMILFAFFSVLCAVSSGIKTPALYLFYSLTLLFISRLPMKAVISRVFFANLFIAFIWIFVPLNYPGNIYIPLGLFKISDEGIRFALSITLKCNAIILATITLLSTSSVFSLAHAMVHLKMPKKLVTLFFLFYRYITVIHEEYERIKRAALLRGFLPKTDIHTYRTYAYIVGGMLLKSYERAEDIYKAMLLRGFNGYFPLLVHFKTKKSDIIFCVISLVVFILIWVEL